MATEALIAREPTLADNLNVFSYSYAAQSIFKYAKRKGWVTVLGQIDPGPEEERIVLEEHRRYPGVAPLWKPAPLRYWDSWRQEVELADRIIVNSEWSAGCLIKEGVPAERIEIIPLALNQAVPEHKDVKALRVQRYTDAKPMRLLFLGQVILRKGIARLLEAMRKIDGYPVVLEVVGPAGIRTEGWSELRNVRFLGATSRSAVDTFYRNADVFILPTLSDGFALTQLEALRHGLPVINSHQCGQVITHGYNGWTLEDVEPDTIASLLRRLVSDPEKVAHARANAHVPNGFDLQSLSERLMTNPERC